MHTEFHCVYDCAVPLAGDGEILGDDVKYLMYGGNGR